MMNKIEKLISKHKWFFLCVIIVFAVVRLCVIFSHRNGHHVDETWSYGLANSYYAPHLYTDQPDGKVYTDDGYKNIGYWISGDVFKDYITVSPNERFSFSSVIYNKKEDISPSLFELMLHFICSFFPDSFSWNYAFAINIVLYILSMFLVYNISERFTGDVLCSQVVTLLFVLSGTGTSNYLYLRVYPLFTTITLALLCELSSICDLKNKNIGFQHYILSFVLTFLGCFTHFYFLIIAFLFTVNLSILLLYKKEYIRLFRLCYTELFSVLLFFDVYPYSLGRLLPFVFGDDHMVSYSFPFSWELAIANKHFFQGTIGFYLDINIFDTLIILFYAFVVAVLIISLFFLFRNEANLQQLKNRMSAKMNNCLNILKAYFAIFNPSLYASLISSILYLIILPITASLVTMGYVERYFFPGMAVFAIGIYSQMIVGVKKINIKNTKVCALFKISICILAAFLLVRSHEYLNVFRFDGPDDRGLYAEVSGKDCFVVTNHPRDLIWMSSILFDCSDVYVDIYKNVFDKEYTYPELDSGCLVMINGYGFVSAEQREQMEGESTIQISDYTIPSGEYTLWEYVSYLENVYDTEFVLLNDYKTNLGDYYVFQITKL